MVGDMISVIDMPGTEESIWWRGKRGFEVGFFPCDCVEVIGDKVPHNLNVQGGGHQHSQTLPHLHRRGSTQSDSPSEPTKPVLRKHGKLITFFRSFILSRPARGKLKKRGILKERVFGCDLGEHLLNSGQEVPKVLTHCSEFIEAKGIVDGIYRLSGISSNIQRLRVAFDEDRIPNLYEDRLVLQDIHSVSSLLKMYFRELPNPVCTFHLYDKFVDAAKSSDDVRLTKLRDVVFQLPPPNYRTLEYLTKHLCRVASKYPDTGMTPKNVAIVWAPNLLRCKSLEVGGVAALQGVGIQAVVTEYLIKYCELIFSDKLPPYTAPLSPSSAEEPAVVTPQTAGKCRPKSLAISTPAKLLSLEEARHRALTACNNIENQKYIEVGGGPNNLPAKYHTVIQLPGRTGGSFKQKKSSTTTAWKNIFSKEKKKVDRKTSTPSELNLLNGTKETNMRLAPKKVTLRPVRSAESLVPQGGKVEVMVSPIPRGEGNSPRNSQESDELGPLETVTTAVEGYRRESPKHHSRSSSHDSYFERKLSVQFKVDQDGEAIDSNLDISEIQVNFDLEDHEMKIFSEDETMVSTSVGSELSLPRSPLEEMPRMISSSPNAVGLRSNEPLLVRGSTNLPHLESPTKSRRRSFKEKLRKFTSPTLSRRQGGSPADLVFSTCPQPADQLMSGEAEESRVKSPLKKKINLSPQGPDAVKRTKLDLDADVSSLSFSPSIKFIDASSSYELVSDSETDTEKIDIKDPIRNMDSSLMDGLETARNIPTAVSTAHTSTQLPVQSKESRDFDSPTSSSSTTNVADPQSSMLMSSSILSEDPTATVDISSCSEQLVHADNQPSILMSSSQISEDSTAVVGDKKSCGGEQLVLAQVHCQEGHVTKDTGLMPSRDQQQHLLPTEQQLPQQPQQQHLEKSESFQSNDIGSTGGSSGSFRSEDQLSHEQLSMSSRKPSSTRSDISFSLAGATISENESFGSISTEDGILYEQVATTTNTASLGDMDTNTEADNTLESVGVDTLVDKQQESDDSKMDRIDDSDSELPSDTVHLQHTSEFSSDYVEFDGYRMLETSNSDEDNRRSSRSASVHSTASSHMSDSSYRSSRVNSVSGDVSDPPPPPPPHKVSGSFSQLAPSSEVPAPTPTSALPMSTDANFLPPKLSSTSGLLSPSSSDNGANPAPTDLSLSANDRTTTASSPTQHFPVSATSSIDQQAAQSTKPTQHAAKSSLPTQIAAKSSLPTQIATKSSLPTQIATKSSPPTQLATKLSPPTQLATSSSTQLARKFSPPKQLSAETQANSIQGRLTQTAGSSSSSSTGPAERKPTPPRSTPGTPHSLLNSPQFEPVTLRRSPVTSPARNRSVRSDFILNLVETNPTTSDDLSRLSSVQEKVAEAVQEAREPLRLDITAGSTFTQKKLSPTKVSGLAKAMSPQPYNKPVQPTTPTSCSVKAFKEAKPSPKMNGVTTSKSKQEIQETLDQARDSFEHLQVDVDSQEKSEAIVKQSVLKSKDSIRLLKPAAAAAVDSTTSPILSKPPPVPKEDSTSKLQTGKMSTKSCSRTNRVEKELEGSDWSSLNQKTVESEKSGDPLSRSTRSLKSVESFYQKSSESLHRSTHSLKSAEQNQLKPAECSTERSNNSSSSLEDPVSPTGSINTEEYIDSLPADGRRSTQGIPEVEKKLSFQHESEQFQKGTEAGARKSRAKSSTLSLHATKSLEPTEETPLQRRNSIHNVPYVDVHDPEIRSRMERYKEERRSMMRAKYKAEDYLTEQGSRKKKLSTTSSQESTDSDRQLDSRKGSETRDSGSRKTSESRDSNSRRTSETRDSGSHKESNGSSVNNMEVDRDLRERRYSGRNSSDQTNLSDCREAPWRTEAAIKCLERSVKMPSPKLSLRISEPKSANGEDKVGSPVTLRHKAPDVWKLVDLKQPEPSTLSRKSEQEASKRSWTSTKDVWSGHTPKARPTELDIVAHAQSELSTSESSLVKNSDISTSRINFGQIDETVNVKERATLFGSRKAEPKLRTVSVGNTIERPAVNSSSSTAESKQQLASGADKSSSCESKKPRKHSAMNPTSPSKIKNMAALFEHNVK